MRQANEALREQEERLARMPEDIDSLRISREQLRRSTTAGAPQDVDADGDDTLQPMTVAAAAAVDAADQAKEELSAPRSEEELVLSVRQGRLGVTPVRALASEDEAVDVVDAQVEDAVAVAGSAAEGGALGTEAALRYHKAQLKMSLEELERLRALLAAKSSTVSEAEASVRELQQRVSKLERAERTAQALIERERQATAEARKRAEALDRELGIARKESDDTARREKSVGAEQRSKDVRLNRALEELERTKTQLRTLREDREGAAASARAEASRLAAENTRLRKRQSELLLAFKKQAKLIDVLKRQKLHVEAATLLGFTEDEFSRTLELGEALA